MFIVSYVIQVVTDKETSNVSISQACYAMVSVVTLLAHTFLYCAAGEIITQRVSNKKQ